MIQSQLRRKKINQSLFPLMRAKVSERISGLTKDHIEIIVGNTGNVEDEYGGFLITVTDPMHFPWYDVLGLLVKSFEVWVERKDERLLIVSKAEGS